MNTHDKRDFIKDIIKNHLHSQDRKLLMIELMVEDEYEPHDIYDIINDVLILHEWPILGQMINETLLNTK